MQIATHSLLFVGMPVFKSPKSADVRAAADRQRIILANSVLSQSFRAWPGTLERVLTDHRDDPEIWYYLGVACRILGQGPESERVFVKARSLDYQEPDTKAHQAGIQVGPE
jgi:Flp pilus assembly protein TadD